jgi:hypothetical protein
MDPGLASLLEAERIAHGVWRRASHEPLRFCAVDTGDLTEAQPATRYFVRQLERLGARIIEACEGEAPFWRFHIRFTAPFEIVRKVQAADGFDVILRGGEPPVWQIEPWYHSPSESSRDHRLSLFAEIWEQKLGALGIADLRYTPTVGSA